MSSTDEHLQDIKRMLAGSQVTIVGFALGVFGGATTSTTLLLLGILIVLLGCIITAMSYIPRE